MKRKASNEKLRKIILASGSPQRRRLLKRAKIPFFLMPSRFQEPEAGQFAPSKVKSLVLDLALGKALEVSQRWREKPTWILGADTVVCCRGKILGKPRDVGHAEEMLRLLSGSWQTVWTGMVLLWSADSKIYLKKAQTSKILFKKIDDKTIGRLAAQNLDKSGAYAIQSMRDKLVQKLIGDFENIIGLPTQTVKELIQKGEKKHAL